MTGKLHKNKPQININGIQLHDLKPFIPPLRKDNIIFCSLMILDQNLDVLISM